MKKTFLLICIFFLFSNLVNAQSSCNYVADIAPTCDVSGSVWHCKGLIKLDTASSSAVRSGSFYVPKFSHIDEIDINLCNTKSKKHTFVVYSTKFVDIGEQTLIAVNAREVKGHRVPDLIICEYEIWGKR